MIEAFGIAGKNTNEDWRKLLPDLQEPFQAKAWRRAYDEFFMKRLNTRYFQPIHAIKKVRTNQGSGFSIVTLHFSMMEFLQAIREGKKYKYRAKPEDEHFYGSSGPMFQRFLSENKPFSDWVDFDQAADIFRDVRCALFHEARTRQPWKIRLSRHKEAPKVVSAIDYPGKIIYRDKLDGAMKAYLKNYQTELMDSSRGLQLRKNFVRCFEHYCDS